MTDSSLKVSNPLHSPSHQHYNLSRTLLLRRSRHHYGHQYHRRNSANHADASTALGKIIPCDEKLSFKLSNHSTLNFGQHTGGTTIPLLYMKMRSSIVSLFSRETQIWKGKFQGILAGCSVSYIGFVSRTVTFLRVIFEIYNKNLK